MSKEELWRLIRQKNLFVSLKNINETTCYIYSKYEYGEGKNLFIR